MEKFNWTAGLIAFFITLVIAGAISWLIIYEAYTKKGLSITTPVIIAVIVVLLVSILVGWGFGYAFRKKGTTEIQL